ncbi:MAG: DUF4317 domain-containing protein [Lachnospiraceae bacterium]|nr:DUF4317 domain-containing protein [Lachnospiraceae bacterium]
MTKKDVLELKRRFKKNECTFTKLCGCYVDGQKNIVVHIQETFLNLQDEEFFKYLEIAKKTLSGTIGNNLLELEFPAAEENPGGRQQFLMGLKDSKLKNTDLLDRFYQMIIDSYDYVGNYLILIFHDAYDVITRTNDNAKLDESEEVYEYLLCAICPVELTKPGLGYREDEHRIGARIRDWVVSPPENGFLFPAFSDRSSDIHSVVYYTKNAKDTHPEFMETGLGCNTKKTATEQKETFQTIVKKALGGDEEKSTQIIMEIQENINDMVEDHKERSEKDADPIVLTSKAIAEVIAESGISQELTQKISEEFEEEFGETPPVAEHLIDSKLLAVSEQQKEKKELVKQVATLKQKLVEKESASESPITDSANAMEDDLTDMDTVIDSGDLDDTDADASDPMANAQALSAYDVVLKVKPQKMTQITSQMINGKKCLVIPMDEDEHANVNGVTTLI